jgi:hypothetical protein
MLSCSSLRQKVNVAEYEVLEKKTEYCNTGFFRVRGRAPQLDEILNDRI